MAKVLAGITMSVDGYIAAPGDVPGRGLGDGGEALHQWVFGGPWKYSDQGRAEAEPDDAAWLEQVTSRIGAVVGGRWTYEAARHWGDKNPWGLSFFIVTHRPEEQPSGGEFQFVDGVEPAIERALEAAGERDINVMGGADTIRQALSAGLVDQLTIIVAPLILGAGRACSTGSRSRSSSSSSGCVSPGLPPSSTTA